MTQEPDTTTPDTPPPANPLHLAAQQLALAGAGFDAVTQDFSTRLDTARQEQAAQHSAVTEALDALAKTADSILHSYAETSAHAAKELGRIKQQALTNRDALFQKLGDTALFITQHVDPVGAHLKELAADHTAHHKLTGTVLDQVAEIPGTLAENSTAALDQLGRLAAAVAEHQALSDAMRDQLSAIPGALAEEGGQTREQVTAAISMIRDVLDAISSTGQNVQTLETALAAVIAAARDQILAPLRAQGSVAAENAERTTDRFNTLHHILEGLTLTASGHSDVLTAIGQETAHTARVLATGITQVTETVAKAGDDNRRIALDAEQRLSAAISLVGEHTGQALSAISAAVQGIGDSVGELAGQTATAESVDTLRGDVSALSELLATTTEDFSGAIRGAVQEIAAMRASWSQESAQLLQAVDRMSRAFLEKSNASEYARDQAVIELGRRVARLELDKPAAAIVSG